MQNITRTDPNEPIIRAVPTLDMFRKYVDLLVSPEADFNDEAVAAYINTVMTLADPENEHASVLAGEGARYAFTKTRAFETAFRDFAGWPERCPFPADKITITVPGGREM